MARRKTGNGFFARKFGWRLEWAVRDDWEVNLSGGERISCGSVGEEVGQFLVGVEVFCWDFMHSL